MPTVASIFKSVKDILKLKIFVPCCLIMKLLMNVMSKEMYGLLGGYYKKQL